MTTKAKPAVVSGGVEILEWRACERNSLRGFFSVRLPSGLVLHNLMLHEKNDSRWIGFPAKEYLDQSGQKQYSRFVEFATRDAADRFRDLVLPALDNHRAGYL